MLVYCKAHPAFEGLDAAEFHDHVEKDHKDDFLGCQSYEEYKERLKSLVAANFEIEERTMVRKSDKAWVKQTWGVPPKMGIQTADNDVE